MNNKGQSLVLFIVILPLIFIIGVFVFDVANMYSEKTKLNNIAYDALYYKYTNHQTIEAAKQLVYKNDPKIKIDQFTENVICISKDTEPLFANAIGYDKFTIKSCHEANYAGGILRIEEKGD